MTKSSPTLVVLAKQKLMFSIIMSFGGKITIWSKANCKQMIKVFMLLPAKLMYPFSRSFGGKVYVDLLPAKVKI